jgi:VanZ family protein
VTPFEENRARSTRVGRALLARPEPAEEEQGGSPGANAPPLARIRHAPRWLRRPIMIGAALLYAAGLLWPYDWAPPKQLTNGARPLADGRIEFVSPGLARTELPPAWLADAIRSNRLELSLTLRSAAPNQYGPARILTISPNPHRRDLMLGQEGSDLVLRLRTPGTSSNGTIDGKPVALVANVFKEPGWIRVGLLIKPGELQIAVDDGIRVREVLSQAPLQDWDASFPMALGNELSGNRPWLGSIGRVIVRTGDITVDYTDPSALDRPATYWSVSNYPKLEPFRDSSRVDLVVNAFLYLPLGVLFGLCWLASGWRGAISAASLIAALSGTLEVAQLFISIRNPSIDDFVLNALGGTLGVLLGRWIARMFVFRISY